jgi:hypothetical protein
MLRSAPPLRRGALLIRGPCFLTDQMGPGSAVHREEALHRVRDTASRDFKQPILSDVIARLDRATQYPRNAND